MQPGLPGLQIDGHIVLVGLPGSGKTTVGRRVARRLSRPLLDFDQEIEKRTGMSIARFFAESGEEEFRGLEMALTRELAAAPPMILSPGGGWIANPGAIELLRPPAILIHLLISPHEALRRLARARVARPLLMVPDPAAAMEALWRARAELYNRADIVLNVEVIDTKGITDSIVTLARGGTLGIG